MKVFKLLNAWGLVGLTIQTAMAFADVPMVLKIPFTAHSLPGTVDVTVRKNEDPTAWGYRLIYPGEAPLDVIKGFPVCIANVQYPGQGYLAQMGWIQFLTFTIEGDEKTTVILDRPPLLNDSKSPYAYWGLTPALFDAPAMLMSERLKRPGVNWRADSFLVVSPDGVMTKTVKALASFSWGYKTGHDQSVEIAQPKATNLLEWPGFAKILRQKFPDWTFEN